MLSTDVDVLILGAGLSGVGMAAQLGRLCPEEDYLVLERRDQLGGTWDLFRYPGVRCDSDMFTLGYAFRPWTGDRTIVDAASIHAYLTETALEHGVLERIRYGHSAVRASWSSADARWTVTARVEASGEERTFCARFLADCTGYYSYADPHRPRFPGQEGFLGDIIHAQQWDPSYDYSGKRVVIVGSGATAVTIGPAMTERAARVTMLQRSPSYMLGVPSRDPSVRWMRRLLPDDVVARLTRNRNTLLQLGLYRLCVRQPEATRKLLLRHVERALGPDVDMRHFTPRYDPWEQRLCVVPDGDFFTEVREGRLDVVTDQIERVVESGLVLESGETLEADLIVLATGFELQLGGGVEMFVDGEAVDRSGRLSYRGTMFDGVPNYAMVFGYVNVAWTRKADLVFEYVCRLLQHMARTGERQVTPRGGAPYLSERPFVDMKSGYLKRGAAVMPRQGTSGPWKSVQNVLRDTVMLRYRPLRDRFLEFSNSAPREAGARRGASPSPRDARQQSSYT